MGWTSETSKKTCCTEKMAICSVQLIYRCDAQKMCCCSFLDVNSSRRWFSHFFCSAFTRLQTFTCALWVPHLSWIRISKTYDCILHTTQLNLQDKVQAVNVCANPWNAYVCKGHRLGTIWHFYKTCHIRFTLHVFDLEFMFTGGGDDGMTVPDCVSTFVRVTPEGIF